MIKKIIFSIFLFSFSISLYSQDSNGYDFLMNQKKYDEAIPVILDKVKKIYDERVDNKRIPNDFIIASNEDEVIDLNRLFRERKIKSFFISDDEVLFKLHKDLGKCYFETADYDNSLKHYYQALRYHALKYEKDDEVFYEISQVFKKQEKMNAYYNSLETAYEFNPANYEYSLELGKALYRTREKKRSIYHLKRYIEFKGDALEEISLYIMIGNLNEDIGRYLETVRYYKKYLEKKNDDGNIYFSLGYLSFNKTGDLDLAIESLNNALKYLKDDDIYRRSKSYEYIGDIYFKKLKMDMAINAYLETVKYQDLILKKITASEQKISELREKIRELKSLLLKRQDYVKFNQYQFEKQDMLRLEVEKKEIIYEYNKLNSGKIRWNLAECYEKKEELEKAISYYRKSISFNYNSNKAREKIIKLKLKIKRGY